jgi:hypothetical protein
MTRSLVTISSKVPSALLAEVEHPLDLEGLRSGNLNVALGLTARSSG